jgi:hypothetical protein
VSNLLDPPVSDSNPDKGPSVSRGRGDAAIETTARASEPPLGVGVQTTVASFDGAMEIAAIYDRLHKLEKGSDSRPQDETPTKKSI